MVLPASPMWVPAWGERRRCSGRSASFPPTQVFFPRQKCRMYRGIVPRIAGSVACFDDFARRPRARRRGTHAHTNKGHTDTHTRSKHETKHTHAHTNTHTHARTRTHTSKPANVSRIVGSSTRPALGHAAVRTYVSASPCFVLGSLRPAFFFQRGAPDAQAYAHAAAGNEGKHIEHSAPNWPAHARASINRTRWFCLSLSLVLHPLRPAFFLSRGAPGAQRRTQTDAEKEREHTENAPPNRPAHDNK